MIYGNRQIVKEMCLDECRCCDRRVAGAKIFHSVSCSTGTNPAGREETENHCRCPKKINQDPQSDKWTGRGDLTNYIDCARESLL